MNGNLGAEPQLGPDFAARVLDSADRVVARRRRIRMTGASALCAGIAATAVWLNFSTAPQGPAQARNPVLAADLPASMSTETAALSAERDGSFDALSWFFPDAVPLSRYAAEGAGDDSSTGDDTAATLLADDE